MNFIIGKNWTKLQEIIGEKYNDGVEYRIHLNSRPENSEVLAYTISTNIPNVDARGSEVAGYSDIYVESGRGKTFYLKSKFNPLDVEISEVV